MKRHIAAAIVIVGLPSLLPIGCGSDSCEDTGTCGGYDGAQPQCDGYFHNPDGSICDTCPKQGTDGIWRWPDGRVWEDEGKLNCNDAGSDVDGAAGSSGSGGSGGTGGEDAGDAGDAGDADGAAGTGGDASEEYYCDPTWLPGDDPCVIDDAFGIFVSPTGEDGASCGTEGSPCASVGQGMSRAKATGKRVYVCGDGGTFEESVVVDGSVDGLKLFGGFQCSGWAYTPGSVKAVVEPATGPALVVENLSVGLDVRDFAFRSADATPGENSVAAFVREASGVIFRNSTFNAGNGGAGAEGTPGENALAAPAVGQNQQGLPSTCGTATGNSGGAWLTEHACAAGGTTGGGQGGAAKYQSPGASGDPGTPDTNVETPVMGQGGPGGANQTDAAGKAGVAGSDGLAGTNGLAAGLGQLTSNGYAPAGGNDGTNGNPGQGGGGSGASWSKTGCVGPSGGAGGLGGCGGFAGTKGMGGGASIGLLVWNSDVQLESCELVSAAGGKGGDGGNGGEASSGRPGGGGGIDGEGGMANAEQGGHGGNGGPGGSGSGGTGGPSFALVFHGTAPVEQGSVVKTPGSGGLKGSGGQAVDGVKAPDGTDGDSAPVFEVP